MDSIDNDNNGGNFSDSVDSILSSVLDFESESEDTSLYPSLVEALSNPPLFSGISGHGNDDLNMHPGIDNLLEELTATDTLEQDILWLFSMIGDAEFGSNNFETRQSRSLEDFLENNDVFEGALRGNPTPPAARFVVEGLPEVEMKGGTDRVCVICSEEIAEGKKVKMLPCWHYYHGECIMPWLKMKNTCPVCRFELPTDDEIEGYLRRKRRRILEPDTDNGNANANGNDGGSLKDVSVRHSFELSLMLDYEDWKQRR